MSRRSARQSRSGAQTKYKGATETTKTLFNYWFGTDHRRPDGHSFQYYYAQREALETLVWLYEVEQIRRHRDLVERFAKVPGIHVLQYDDFARYAIKMATGSGKTKVMALTVAWQYFNAVAEGRSDYARTFLVVAPNVIVFERLRSDFGGGPRLSGPTRSSRPSFASSGRWTSTCEATPSEQARRARCI